MLLLFGCLSGQPFLKGEVSETKYISKARKTFIKNVNTAILKLDVKIPYVSKKTELSSNYVRNVLKGNDNISLDNCQQIIDAIELIAKEQKQEINQDYFR